jgi:pyroglutamyl-peptidase
MLVTVRKVGALKRMLQMLTHRPCSTWITWLKKIRKMGIPAATSRNAGNSLCNKILNHGLHYAKEYSLDLKCGFLHIPALPEQVISRWPQHPFMPLEMSRQAVGVIFSELYLSC